MRKYFQISLLALLTVVSCQQQVQHGRTTIPLVYDIANGTDASAKVVMEHGTPTSDGEVFLAGSPMYTSLLAARFLECDMADNVRGRAWSDGLKDFAGETFSCITDVSFAPYASLSSGPDSLRELAVRYAIAALDTHCNVSVYDLDGNASKASAKMLVLSDPWLYRYGKFDIDTLFTMTGRGIPVVSPQQLMLDAVLAGEKKSFNVGIICDSSYVGKGIYPEIFRAAAAEHNVVGARCTEGSGNLYGFLDTYIASGATDPLDAILIDDLSANLEELTAQVAAINSYSREESMKYGRYISRDLRIFNSGDLTMQKCYEILRSHNLFTHKIAQPMSRTYEVYPRPWASDMQFLLIPVDNV